jgi:hypothetical protein
MRSSQIVAAGLVAFAFACATNATFTDPLADTTIRAQGTVTLSASHSPGSSSVAPSVAVSFVPDTSGILTSCGQTQIASCTISQAPDCKSLACGIGETCGWDDGCNAACVQACTLSCGSGQKCHRGGDGTQSCVAIQTFDAGPIAISGGTMPITVYPPYGWKSTNEGAPFAPGASLRVQAQGPTGAGFAAFDISFQATTLMEANPPLDQLDLNQIFGGDDVMLGWVPGSDRVYVNLQGAGGSARCLAQDSSGAFSLPRDAINTVLGTSDVQALSLSLERVRLDRHQDAKTVGSLDSETIQKHAWIDVATMSTESIALQACKTGQTACGAKCASTDTDPNNCGSCGNSCGTGSCYQGNCQTSGGSCSACQVQADSSSGMCASEYASCTGTCKSLLTCVMGCNGNTTCAQSCYSTYSSGVTAFNSYYSCLCGSACGSECATQCGQ